MGGNAMAKNLLRMLLVISFVAGCGGIKETVVPVTGAAAGGGAVELGVNKVAIFPFADYSLQEGMSRLLKR
jgi:hypothetical protein